VRQPLQVPGWAGIPGVRFQKINPECEPSFQNFTILVDASTSSLSRDDLHEALNDGALHDAQVTSTRLFTTRRAYAGKKVRLPVTEEVSDQALCLPLHKQHGPLRWSIRCATPSSWCSKAPPPPFARP